MFMELAPFEVARPRPATDESTPLVVIPQPVVVVVTSGWLIRFAPKLVPADSCQLVAPAAAATPNVTGSTPACWAASTAVTRNQLTCPFNRASSDRIGRTFCSPTIGTSVPRARHFPCHGLATTVRLPDHCEVLTC